MLSSDSVHIPLNEVPKTTNMSYLASLSNMSAPTLWSSTLSQEYLQVQVLADTEAPFEKSTDDVLNMNTYTCHICDFEVPKQYSEEHKNGENHKNLLKIADLALGRTRKQITSDVKQSKITIQVAGTYFCDQCAVVVLTGNKSVHETSENHMKLLKYSKLVHDFLMVYEDKDAIDLIIQEINVSNGIKTLIPDNNEINSANNILDEFNEHQIGVAVDSNKSKLNNSEVGTDAYKGHSESDIESNTQHSNLNETEVEPDFSKEQPTTSPKVGSKVQNSEINFDVESLDGRLTQLLGQLQTTIGERFEEDTQSTNHKTSKENKDPQQNGKPATKKRRNKKGTPKNLQHSNEKDTEENELGKYLKIVTDKCETVPIHSVEALCDTIVMITTINGDQIKVPVNNFHSTHGQKNKLFCKICVDPNIGYEHQNSEEHMEKVMIAIEDKNAIRKIDDIWSHCILCNDLTKDVTFHLQSLMHKKKLKQCVVVSDTDVNENVIAPQPVVDASQSVQEHSLIASHNNLEMSCNICEDTIPNQVSSIVEHVKTFKHITNYNTTIEDNRMNEIDDEQYYCVPCDMCVAKRYALGHCNGKKHHKHLADVKKAEEKESTQVLLPSISQQITRQKPPETESDLICFVCNVVLSSVDKHSNSLEHKKSYLSYLEGNKLNEIEQDTFYCIPCNTVILIDCLMNHCTSNKHKTHLNTCMGNTSNPKGADKTSQLIGKNTHISRAITKRVKESQASTASQNPPPVSQNGVSDKAIPLKFLYQFREMSNAKNLFCTICDEEVPYRKYDVQHHVNSIDHVVAFNLMMLWNKIKIMDDKYFCDQCKVNVTYFNELSHITGAKHVDVMAKQPKGTVYEYDKVLLTLEYAMSHKTGDRVRPSALISVNKQKETKQ